MARLLHIAGPPPVDTSAQLANEEMTSTDFPYGTGDGYFGGNWYRYYGYCYIADGVMTFPTQDFAWQDRRLDAGNYIITIKVLNAASVPLSVRVNAQGGAYLLNTIVQGPAEVSFPFTVPDLAMAGNGERVEVSNNGASIDFVRLRKTS